MKESLTGLDVILAELAKQGFNIGGLGADSGLSEVKVVKREKVEPNKVEVKPPKDAS